MRSNPGTAKGFTLLEVMVALTITGLALGGLFGVIAGSKRLAWRAEQALVHSTQVRSLINFSQLNDEQGEVFISFENDELSLFTGTTLEMPERKTVATNEELRSYEITDEDGEVIAGGTYWMFPEQPEMPAAAAAPVNQPALGIRGISADPAASGRNDPDQAPLQDFIRRGEDPGGERNNRQRPPPGQGFSPPPGPRQ